MLEISGLTVEAGDRLVLRDVDLAVGRGEAVALLGPNGSGKTSLLHAVMGMPGYRVLSGRIVFRGEEITGMPVDERARLGIGLAFQRPPAVRGVQLGALMETVRSAREGVSRENMADLFRLLDLSGFEGRDVNLGFSGGEIKRSEVLQLLAQAPELALLDEPDSGVDLVSIRALGEAVNLLLERGKEASVRARSGLIITHEGHILDYVQADRGYILVGGTIRCTGDPESLLESIRTRGYEECERCVRG